VRILAFSLLFENLRINIYRSVILPVDFYGCKTWSFTLRIKKGLLFFENRLLKRTFGLKRDQVKEDWRRLHKE
jgi:hypothetical protein